MPQWEGKTKILVHGVSRSGPGPLKRAQPPIQRWYQVALARHPSGIVITDPKMCRGHDPSTQKTAGIHWDPAQKRHDPR